ncbi:Protein translocase subunit SecA [hydrothermal vent metagenome]|uniref:Protein translocase subunit SecA n=1 Tax=hydrothermal vent metagenome TaxID=652676 RepID=A0A3B0Y7E4_9ZZZZ
MIKNLIKRVFGSRNDRLVKQLMADVEKINQLEDKVSALSDDQLKDKTQEFRERFKSGESLDALLSEAFAVVREAGKRVMNMRHFDTQLVGGMVLHHGKIAEMRTGEGKTLVATLAAYLNAIPGKGVHVVTVNDYLAERDAGWMGKLYGFLGMTTGVVISDMKQDAKQEAYAADITYGTNNEFGFDYLRDNMAFSKDELVQREPFFAIVDEVDSILIDEARTPLIISGPVDDDSDIYEKINVLIPQLVKQDKEHDPTDMEAVDTGDFTTDEKTKQVHLTETGHRKVEELLTDSGLLAKDSSLYDSSNISLMHHLLAGLRAHALYQKNVDYIVRDREVLIVDEFTGRVLSGRRWSDGLHQAIEAKEHVTIEKENQTLAAITFQNLFRLYTKLSGMTGTADTEAAEFQQIYKLEVVAIPTNLPLARTDFNDLIFLGVEDKMEAIVEDINDCKQRQQPVLVGTTSIETSEFISAQLTKHKILHEVLNAKQHEREADIVAQAGAPGSVTIATNMAGRGTDIVLGGNLDVELGKEEDKSDLVTQKIKDDWALRHQKVIEAGGLHIIGTERHESRRIDNQLRGRSARQGDPGSTRFYLSLEDNLMRIFASDRVTNMLKRGMTPGEPIEHKMVSRAIENSQRKVEAYYFDSRKNVLEYDDVANEQRKFVYEQRKQLMNSESVAQRIVDMREVVVQNLVSSFIPPASLEEQWDIPGLESALEEQLGARLPIAQWLKTDTELHEETLHQKILAELIHDYGAKTTDIEKEIGLGKMDDVERDILLSVLDHDWKNHLADMDYLRQGIGLQGYAQKNPKQEYKRLAFEMFEELLGRIQYDVIHMLSTSNILSEEESFEQEKATRSDSDINYMHAEAPGMMGEEQEHDEEQEQPYVREGKKVGRNDPCPCGSGKKYKKCHGKLT